MGSRQRYEYSRMSRDNADYQLNYQTITFIQPDTTTNMFFTGIKQDWTEQFNTYVRYRWIDNDYPLVGVREWTELNAGLDSAINSNLPNTSTGSRQEEPIRRITT